MGVMPWFDLLDDWEAAMIKEDISTIIGDAEINSTTITYRYFTPGTATTVDFFAGTASPSYTDYSMPALFGHVKDGERGLFGAPISDAEYVVLIKTTDLPGEPTATDQVIWKPITSDIVKVASIASLDFALLWIRRRNQ